jgi:amino acid transporter
MITAELATALPEASGSVAWVTVAFGPFWGWMEGWLSLVSGIIDNALYPVLFLDCLVQLFSSYHGETAVSAREFLQDTDSRFFLIMCITGALTWLTYRGLDVVGNLALYLSVISLTPFIAFCIVGAFQVQPDRWMNGPTLDPSACVDPPCHGTYADVNWRLLLNTFFWNINYWDSSAAFSGDVDTPEKTFPKGLKIAVVLVALGSFFPILVGTGASSADSTEWTDGYFVQLSTTIAGPWLGLWMICASALTNIGMFVSEMSSDAWMISGMAERGLIPKVFGARNRHDTPTWGVLVSAVGVVGLAYMSFVDIIDMLNMIFCVAQAIEFSAFIYLRIYRDDLHRPYRIPIPTPILCLFLCLPVAFIGIIISFSSWNCLVLCVVVVVTGVVLHYVLDYCRDNGVCEFEPTVTCQYQSQQAYVPIPDVELTPSL